MPASPFLLKPNAPAAGLYPTQDDGRTPRAGTGVSAPGLFSGSLPGPAVAAPTGEPAPGLFPAGATFAQPSSNPSERPADAGAPLPLGAPVKGSVPGLYESVRTTPLYHDPVGGTVSPSRYTLTQTTPIQPRSQSSAGPSGQFNREVEARALAGALGGPPQAGLYGVGGGIGGAPSEFSGATGDLMSAASLLEEKRKAFAAGDRQAQIAGPNGSNLPQAGQPPEVRAARQAYADKVVGRAISQEPAFARPGGGVSSTAELARLSRELGVAASQPRLTTLGNDSRGRPVEGVADKNGNFSRIVPTAEKASGVQLVQVGPTPYFYHAESKRYFDHKGQPVNFGDGGTVAAIKGIFGSQESGQTAAAQTQVQPPAEVPPGAIEFLRKNPSKRKAFDAKYGAGASDQWLPR
jgi:hypothetical protein